MKQFLKNIHSIFSSYTLIDALRLFFAYLSLIIKNRTSWTRTTETFLGYNISFPFRPAFFGLITEIFLQPFYPVAKNDNQMLIFDCGANIGIRTLYFHWLYPQARFECFEPNPVVLEFLQKNIHENNIHATVHAIGVGGKEGSFDLYRGEGVRGSGSATVVKQGSEFNEKNKITIHVKKLSEFITKKVDIVKLDVEGVEGEIVEDLALQNKLQFIDQMIIEYHFDGVNLQYPLDTLLGMLQTAGFTITKTPLVSYNEDVKPVLKTCMIFAKRN